LLGKKAIFIEGAAIVTNAPAIKNLPDTPVSVIGKVGDYITTW